MLRNICTAPTMLSKLGMKRPVVECCGVFLWQVLWSVVELGVVMCFRTRSQVLCSVVEPRSWEVGGGLPLSSSPAGTPMGGGG